MKLILVGPVWLTVKRASLAGVLFSAPMLGLLEKSLMAASVEEQQQLTHRDARVEYEALLIENSLLREQMGQAETSRSDIQKTLVDSNAEAALLNRKMSELMLRSEALGVDFAAKGNSYEQRLLKLVSDLRIARNECEKLQEAVRTVTAQLRSAHPSKGSDATKRIDDVLRRSSEIFKRIASDVPQLPESVSIFENGTIIALREDLGVAVVNVGRSHGVKIGTPLRVARDGEDIALIRIIDVRERISGAVIQELRAGFAQIGIGDRLNVVATAK